MVWFLFLCCDLRKNTYRDFETTSLNILEISSNDVFDNEMMIIFKMPKKEAYSSQAMKGKGMIAEKLIDISLSCYSLLFSST